jgi:serine/threonine protein phosphatase PrpC
MELETAQATLVGDRADNQDRAEILIGDEATLALLADGMGGHSNGGLAAETAIASLSHSFRAAHGRSAEPEEFLLNAIAEAHEKVLALGDGMALETKPGTIIVCALIYEDTVWWAHVGDSRAYHLRGGKILERTHDHTEIDALLTAGKITQAEADTHRNRHIVDFCLGVAPETPPIVVERARHLAAEDIILLCSDGLWGQVKEATLVARLSQVKNLDKTLSGLVDYAARTGRPHSDNVTAIALRAIEDH